MSCRKGQYLNRAKKLLLASAGVAAMAGPLAIGIGYAPAIHAQTQIAGDPAKASPLAFEVASVKLHVFARGQRAFATASRESDIRISGNRVTTQGLLAGLVMTAYKLRTFQVSGAPEWRDETGRIQLYDIEARAPGDGAPATGRGPADASDAVGRAFPVEISSRDERDAGIRSGGGQQPGETEAERT
jgi:hypothetical protein